MTELYTTSENGFAAVYLRTDESVNAWQGNVLLPGSHGALISTEGVHMIWQTPPRYENGAIVFSGGMPGGVKGDTLLFRFTPDAPSNIFFSSDTRVYLNDGKGTEIVPETSSSRVVAGSKAVLGNDTVPPEPFALTLYRSGDLFNGQPVIIFGAEDRGSGVAGYEAKEYTTHGDGAWHTAQSPYLVNPDVRKIEIKAVDYAGNERLEAIRIAPSWWKISGGILTALILGSAIGYTIYIRWKRSL